MTFFAICLHLISKEGALKKTNNILKSRMLFFGCEDKGKFSGLTCFKNNILKMKGLYSRQFPLNGSYQLSFFRNVVLCLLLASIADRFNI